MKMGLEPSGSTWAAERFVGYPDIYGRHPGSGGGYPGRVYKKREGASLQNLKM